MIGVPELTSSQYRDICAAIYRLCGIHLRDGKEELVKSRLAKRLRALGLPSFDDYLTFLDGPEGADEIPLMIDCLTTNKTSFFREEAHFEFLTRQILPRCGPRIRIWCAGCSSGEEPYSFAMTLLEHFPDAATRDLRILATDISTKVLAKARTGVYESSSLEDVPAPLLSRYFQFVQPKAPRQYEIRPEPRNVVSFARLNLMEEWPMKGPFDLISCRNVMIYFDKETQERLINRYAGLLRPGGHLFVGHSESLAGIRHGLKYIQPAVYEKQ